MAAFIGMNISNLFDTMSILTAHVIICQDRHIKIVGYVVAHSVIHNPSSLLQTS